jgi:hypothetical protein
MIHYIHILHHYTTIQDIQVFIQATTIHIQHIIHQNTTAVTIIQAIIHQAYIIQVHTITDH